MLNTTKLKKKHLFHFIKTWSSTMYFPFPSSHNSHACYLFLINQQKHIDNQHQNPLQVSQNVFYIPCKMVITALLFGKSTTMFVIMICCHIDLPLLSYWFAYFVILFCLLCILICLHMFSSHADLPIYLLSISFS